VSEFRQHIVDYLVANGPIEDASGRATTVLKESVGYTSGDAAFSTLVSSMEKDGRLKREIRGRRTFRISASSEAEASSARLASAPATTEGFDYDELAAALLVRVTRLLAQEPTESSAWARRRIDQLEGRIDELQRELARAKADAKNAAEERDELRGQLEAASHNLSLLTEQRQSPKPGRAAERLGSDEQALLYELRGQRRRPGRAG
jgi:chromosome segregation ATPase